MKVHETLESLNSHLSFKFGADFDRLSIRNYGFQAPGLLDPNRTRNGRKISGIRGLNATNEPVTVPVILGKIAPLSSEAGETEEDIFQFAHAIGSAIVEWSNCKAKGLSKSCVVNFEVTREQDSKMAGNQKNAWWWVLRWQFELVGWFDV